MKLDSLQEGVAYIQQRTPDETIGKEPERVRAAGKFVYSPTDKPGDFLRTGEIFGSVSLPNITVGEKAVRGRYALSGTRDRKIYYAFTSEQRPLILALGRAIKNPNYPGEEDIQKIMLDLSVKAIQKLEHQYDIVTYPASSSPFNQMLAERLKLPALQVDKTKVGEDFDVNVREMVRTGILRKFFALTNKKIAGNTKPLGDKELKDARYPFAYAMRTKRNIEALLRPDAAPSVKNAEHQMRRYMNLYRSIDSTKLSGKSVLIIDDNVSTLATSEILLGVIQRANPAHVDMFTPLYIG